MPYWFQEQSEINASILLQIQIRLMNVQHKCLFHGNNPIVKFCQNRECTLPLCLECEPIHLSEHSAQQSQAQVMRFNEATLKAANDMEDYLDNYKRFVQEQQNKIENDRELAIKIIDQYYAFARKMLEEVRNNAEKVEEQLGKLRKGSIKTLIFYYSGDIKLDKFDLEFEPLHNRIRDMLQNGGKEEKTQTYVRRLEHKQNRQERAYQMPEKVEYQKYTSNQSQGSNIVQNNNPLQRLRNTKNHDTESQNIFSNIQEIKEGRNRERTRKSIFENNKKSSIITPAEPVQKQPEVRYNYRQDFQYREDTNRAVQPSPKFHYDISNDYKYPSYQKSAPFEPQAPLSFENRFLHKFSCMDQEINDKRQDVLKKETVRQEVRKYDEVPQPNSKLLKPSDLQLDKQNNFQAAKTIHANYMLSQRNRSLSQNHLAGKEVRKSGYDYDLKKQVLSPEQIRKMLEKKIEERNRILSIKKSDNYQPAAQQKGKRTWQTRDSIINQIYMDNKH